MQIGSATLPAVGSMTRGLGEGKVASCGCGVCWVGVDGTWDDLGAVPGPSVLWKGLLGLGGIEGETARGKGALV